MDDALLDALRRAVESTPDDAALRLHLAASLLAQGLESEALQHASAVLVADASNDDARDLVQRAILPHHGTSSTAAPPRKSPLESPEVPIAAGPTPPGEYPADSVDWSRLESQLGDIAQPMFVEQEPGRAEPMFDAERPTLRLTDVGGMTEVKARLESSFLAPLRNPELGRLFAKSLRGGLLMYGPPGCGKTFIARALAGELGASFISVAITDVLDPLHGMSEQNLHALFRFARQNAPCLVFFDEIDALGQRRSSASNIMRGVINQLLTEMDGIGSINEGVFILAATNQPWDIDPALRRPGKLDRTVLVLPPDLDARIAIFQHHLDQRPVEGIDLAALARASDGLSGADIAYVCELAAERALMTSARTGVITMISMRDMTAALADVQPSTLSWLNSARNVVMFGDDDSTYAQLKTYLKQRKRL